jgi:hypothetical protein
LQQRGGWQAGIGPAAAAELGPAAGLLVFLIGAVMMPLQRIIIVPYHESGNYYVYFLYIFEQ